MKPILLAVVLAFAAAPAAAQEPGQAGLTVGFPGSIGVIWHMSDAIAVRPDFSFVHTKSKSGSLSATESSGWGIGFGISALFYTGKVRDNVRPYFTPRFSYNRTNSNSEGTSLISSRQHSNTYQYSGAFGVQYAPVKRFSVYAEAGLAYAHGESIFETNPSLPVVVTSGKSTSDQFGTRAGIGVVIYFD